MKQKASQRQQTALWVISILVVASMVCSLIAILVPSGDDTLDLTPTPVVSPSPFPTEPVALRIETSRTV
ncbi:MAG: hypothetical protein ACYC4R_06940 [Anaerolineae bacterium]